MDDERRDAKTGTVGESGSNRKSKEERKVSLEREEVTCVELKRSLVIFVGTGRLRSARAVEANVVRDRERYVGGTAGIETVVVGVR